MLVVQRPHHILIIGGGFAGVGVALSLSRLRCRSRAAYTVTLVHREPYHVYQPALYEIATAVGDCRKAFLQGLGTFSYRDIFHARDVTVRRDTIERIDRQQCVCWTTQGERITYDTLVIATGATTNYFGIQGAREHSFTLRTFDDALRLRRHIQTLCAPQRNRRAQEKHTIVVVGAGASGVEVAAELQGTLRRIVPAPTSAPKIVLIEAASQILPGQPTTVQAAALRRLQSLGISLMTGTTLTSVTATDVTFSNGTSIATRTVVWTAGVIAQLPAMEPDVVAHDAKGRIVVDAMLRIPGQMLIMALGDCAIIERDGKTLAIPQTASIAIREARWAARAIVEKLNGHTIDCTTQSFQPRFPGYVFPLGGRYALWSSPSGRLVVKGFLAWLVRRCIDLSYAYSITSLRKAITQSLLATAEFVKND